MAKPLSELIKAVAKTPERKSIDFKGEEYEYYATPVTMGERESVKNTQKNKDDTGEFVLRLLIKKAKTKDGKQMFQSGMYAELKNEWPAQELEAAMLQLLGTKDEEEVDPKS